MRIFLQYRSYLDIINNEKAVHGLKLVDIEKKKAKWKKCSLQKRLLWSTPFTFSPCNKGSTGVQPHSASHPWLNAENLPPIV